MIVHDGHHRHLIVVVIKRKDSVDRAVDPLCKYYAFPAKQGHLSASAYKTEESFERFYGNCVTERTTYLY